MSGCRIGKIRMKSGGEVYPLRAPRRDENQKAFIDRIAKMLRYYKEGEMVGYAAISWNAGGEYSTCYYISEESPVGFGLLPSFLADAMRRRMIEEGQWES